MRVIVTGSEGFVGQYICRKFLDEGWQVYGIDNHSKYDGAYRLHHAHSGNFQFVDLDLRDTLKTQDVFRWITSYNEPVLLICCASDVGGINRLSSYTVSDTLDNITIDNNTISAANRCGGIRKIIYLSSSAIYEGLNHTARVKPYKEKEDKYIFHHHLSPYAMYKKEAEETLKNKRKNLIPYVIFRLFNAAGVGDVGEHPHVIADFINRAKDNPDEPFKIMGGGGQTRNFIHGDDIAKIIYESAYLVENDTFNLGTEGNTISMLNLAILAWGRCNPVGKSFKENFVDPAKGDIKFSEPNLDKLHKNIGSSEWSIHHIMDEALQYYKGKNYA